ncbi:MAG: hypothetical protein LOD88_01620, partial [Novibacillus thermophilus]
MTGWYIKNFRTNEMVAKRRNNRYKELGLKTHNIEGIGNGEAGTGSGNAVPLDKAQSIRAN